VACVNWIAAIGGLSQHFKVPRILKQGLFADEKAHLYKDKGVEFFPTRCLRVLSTSMDLATRDAQLQQVLARQGHPHKGFGCHAPYLFAKREPTLPRDKAQNAPTLGGRAGVPSF